MTWIRTKVFPICVVGLGVVLTAASVFSTGAPSGRTGAPGDLTCADSGCHVSFPVNSGDGSVVIEGPASFQSGVPVDLVIKASRPSAIRFGFEITVQDATGAMSGEWEILEGTQLADFGLAPAYLTHSLAKFGTDNQEWTVRWIPPAAPTGDVTFYAAANTANGDNTNFNDYIYTTSLPVVYAGNTAIGMESVPTRLVLNAPYPNPAREVVTVPFELMTPSSVTVYVYDSLGREQLQTRTEMLSTGPQEMRISVDALLPGAYSYRVEAGGHSKMGSLTVLR